jgi:hypothetical protein
VALCPSIFVRVLLPATLAACIVVASGPATGVPFAAAVLISWVVLVARINRRIRQAGR